MKFSSQSVVEHLRLNSDLFAGLLEQVTKTSVEIDTAALELDHQAPEFSAYGLAAWVVCDSRTMAILLPYEILPTEWDGYSFAPHDIGDRLVSALLPEKLSYLPPKLVAIGQVAGAYSDSTKTLLLKTNAAERPIAVLIDLYNPSAVERVGRDRLVDVPVKVSVRLAEKKIDVAQFLAIGPGQLLAFEKGAEDFLDLYVNNHLHARGEAVKIGERFGLRVTKVGIQDVRVSGVIDAKKKPAKAAG